MAAKETFGTFIQISATTITGATGKLPRGTKIGFPNASQGAIDVTNHDSAGGVAEWLPSKIIRYKAFNCELQITPGDTADLACQAAATSGAVYFIKITQNGAAGAFVLTFNAIITDWDVDDAPVEGIYTGKLTLQPTAAVTRA